MNRRAGSRPQRVLVVDDSEDLRELWVAWLHTWGFVVDEAVNGFDAVERATAEPPDLVLMDLWMPGLDGFATAQRLKTDAATAGVPILALSADTFSPTPERAFAAGCEAFLPKPVSAETLLEQIRLAFRRRLQKSRATATSGTRRGRAVPRRSGGR